MQKDDSTEVTNWVEVTFVLPDGTARQCRGELGETLMDVALDNLVPGIVGQCGGGCTCCTCHVYIDNRWFVQLPEPHPDEVGIADLCAGGWRKQPPELPGGIGS